ncbi:hypothetical protein HDU81_005317 [Chytriomyces hyalinus]|nr:hypothetical protein HDU81_005317 [Chytriomyces hyalinus]
MAPQSCSQSVVNAMNDFYNACKSDSLYPFQSLSNYYSTPKGMVADCYIWNGISLTLPSSSPSPSSVKSTTSSRSASSTAPTMETSPTTLDTFSSAEPPPTGPSPTEISTQSLTQMSVPTSKPEVVVTKTTAAAMSPSAGSVVADAKSATPASVGVIVGFLMGALAVGVGIFWYVFRKRRKVQPAARIWENAFFNGGHSSQDQDQHDDALIPLYASPASSPGTSPFVGGNAEIAIIARVGTKSSFGSSEGPVPRRGDTVMERPVHTPENVTLRTATTRTLMSNESVYDDQAMDELSILPPPIPPVYMMHDNSHIIDAYSEPEEIQILSKEKEAQSLAPRRNPFNDILSPNPTPPTTTKTSQGGMSGISPLDWTVDQVALWALTIDSFGPHVSSALRSHGVTGEMLFKLTNEQMREDLGLYRLNDRMSFSAAIERLRPTLAAPPSYQP